MTYKPVLWDNNSSLSDFDKLKQMSDNDDYLYDLAQKTPRGTLWALRENTPGVLIPALPFAAANLVDEPVWLEVDRLYCFNFNILHWETNNTGQTYADFTLYVSYGGSPITQYGWQTGTAYDIGIWAERTITYYFEVDQTANWDILVTCQRVNITPPNAGIPELQFSTWINDVGPAIALTAHGGDT